jgi:hypothetical protein
MRRSRTLNLFFFGPGVGESIAIQLPCGQWGVVDCYSNGNEGAPPVLQFLRERRVTRLAFFCLTHPHADHFLGADRLLEYFKGKVDRLWRYGGISSQDLRWRVASAARARAARTRDPEAEWMADSFISVMNAIDVAAKTGLTPKTYIRVNAPMPLLEGDDYKISAMRPDAFVIDEIERRIANKAAQKGYLLFDEDEGSLVNALSVVLKIEFGKAKIILLGDAEGSTEVLDEEATGFTGVKIAHHGSANGWGAGGMLSSGFASPEAIGFGVITPYARSRLPRSDMVEKYRSATKQLIVTGLTGSARPKVIIPTLANPKLTGGESMYSVAVFASGKVQGS